MSFTPSDYIRTGNLSKQEFVHALSKVTVATSLKGLEYTNITVFGNKIIGERKSTTQPFEISIDKLYDAYKELNVFSTSSLQYFVNRVQSPAMAIMIASKIIAKRSEVNSATKENEEISNKQNEQMDNFRKNILCAHCGKILHMSKDLDGQPYITCTRCGGNTRNPYFREGSVSKAMHWHNGLLKYALFFVIGLCFFIALAYCGDRDIPLVDNGKLTPAAKTEAVQQLKHKLKNSSGYEGGGWTEGVWDPNSDSERYFLIHKFSSTNSFGARIDAEAYFILDKDGKVTSIKILE